MALREDVLVVANEQDIKQWDVVENRVFRDIRKKYLPRGRVWMNQRAMTARRTIDALQVRRMALARTLLKSVRG